MIGRKISASNDGERSRLVEVIGLPGSGKSTLIKSIVADNRRIQNQNDLVKSAALHLLNRRLNLGGLLARSFLGEIVKQRYLASEVNARSYLRENPEVAQGLSEWFAGIKDDIGVQYIGRMIALNQTLKRANLLNNFRPERLTLLDEYWIQLLTVILNAGGDDERFLNWFNRMLTLIPIPDGVVWLSGAYQIAEERQLQRGKMAVIFMGSSDILEKGMVIERRMNLALAALQQIKAPVLKLDAAMSLPENKKIASQWFQDNDLL